MKKVLIFICMLASAWCQLLAQVNDNKGKTDIYSYGFQVGDTVMIRRSTHKYSTLEKIPEWVYYGRYSVQQVYSKYHPQSVLLKEIYSWINVDTLLLITTSEMTNDAKQRIMADRSSVIERYQTLADMDKDKRDSIIYGLKRNNYPFILPEVYFASINQPFNDVSASGSALDSTNSPSTSSVKFDAAEQQEATHNVGTIDTLSTTKSVQATYYFQVGDTVVIPLTTLQYQTGETIPEWVKYGRYSIKQIGGQNHPDAVLLGGIDSWVSVEHLLLYSSASIAPEAVQRVNDDKPRIIEQCNQLTTMNKEERDFITNSLDRKYYAYLLPASYLASSNVYSATLESVSPMSTDAIVSVSESKSATDTTATVVAGVAAVGTVSAAAGVDNQAVSSSLDVSNGDSPSTKENLSSPQVSVSESTADSFAIASADIKDSITTNPQQKSQDSIRTKGSHTERYNNDVNRFTIGVHGGAASLLHQTQQNLGKWKCGYDVVVDLQYAHYWRDKKDNMLGLLIGAGVGYTNSALQSQVNDKYTLSTSAGNIQYTVTADQVNEKDGEVVVEVPIMFSLILRNGFFLNVGPRLSIPVYSHYSQTIVNPNVNAYFEKYGVDVPNEAVTGMVTDGQCKTKGRWNASKVNVMLSAELGYEWTFANRNSLSLGAFANYSVFTLYNNNTNLQSLVLVGNPGDNKAALITIYSATDTYATSLGFFDVGLKLAYHFNFFRNSFQ